MSTSPFLRPSRPRDPTTLSLMFFSLAALLSGCLETEVPSDAFWYQNATEKNAALGDIAQGLDGAPAVEDAASPTADAGVDVVLPKDEDSPQDVETTDVPAACLIAKDCDDGNKCTDDVCDKSAGCVHTSNKVPCDDGDKCADPDACVDGKCVGVAIDVSKKCDDNNPCTNDGCDKSAGCVHTPNKVPCDDDDKCTKVDTCQASKCQGTKIDVLKQCDDNNPCTNESCDPKTGCQNLPNTAACSDGNPCTQSDKCNAGQCEGGVNTCDCQKDSDCKSKEDGNFCNGTLFCDKSASPYHCKIKGSTVVNCDQNGAEPCKENTCEPKTGKCKMSAANTGKSCDADNSVCTQGDICKNGQCVAGAAVNCDDNNPCTDDSCDPKSGCKHSNNTATCSDDNKCTLNDTCFNGTCAGKTKNCTIPGYPCQTRKCVASSGDCEMSNNKDGTKCYVYGVCSKGYCLDAKTKTMAIIPTGDFWAGCNVAKDPLCNTNETPQHLVTLSTFAIDIHEVTVEEYKLCMQIQPLLCPKPPPLICSDITQNNILHKNRSKYPMNCINHNLAQKYCKAQGKKLPTEAQWEKAARGGCEFSPKDCKTHSFVFPWGFATPDCSYDVLWSIKGKGCGSGTTLPVMSGKPNRYGIWNMAGNVTELTRDILKPYTISPTINPVVTGTSGQFVNKGGNFMLSDLKTRISRRSEASADYSSPFLGIRCVKEP